jgi:hypothetical protein
MNPSSSTAMMLVANMPNITLETTLRADLDAALLCEGTISAAVVGTINWGLLLLMVGCWSRCCFLLASPAPELDRLRFLTLLIASRAAATAAAQGSCCVFKLQLQAQRWFLLDQAATERLNKINAHCDDSSFVPLRMMLTGADRWLNCQYG